MKKYEKKDRGIKGAAEVIVDEVVELSKRISRLTSDSIGVVSEWLLARIAEDVMAAISNEKESRGERNDKG